MIKEIRFYLGLMVAVAMLLVAPTNLKAFDGISVGINLTGSNMDTDGFETDPEGTKVTGSVNKSVQFPSLFLQYTHMISDSIAVTVGADYVPLDAEFVAEQKTDTDLVDVSAAGATNSGTKKVNAELKDHVTLYVQPTFILSDAQSIYLSVGYSQADVEADVDLVTSDDFTKTDSLDGFRIGIGTQRYLNDAFFFRLEAQYADYDSVQFTTSDSTKVTAEPELLGATASLGINF